MVRIFLDIYCPLTKTVPDGSEKLGHDVRKKSDEKRQAILDAAYGLFRANGFEKTSMSEITVQVGGSKATLYNYFSSKEELFVDCMFDMADHYLENVYFSLEDPEIELAVALKDFGKNVLRLICSPDLLAARRLMVSEAGRSGIGNLFYEKICSHQKQLAAFIAGAMHEGKLRRSDALLAARQLRSLLEAEIYEPYILCVCDVPPDDAAIVLASERAVAVFLRAYTPE